MEIMKKIISSRKTKIKSVTTNKKFKMNLFRSYKHRISIKKSYIFKYCTKMEFLIKKLQRKHDSLHSLINLIPNQILSDCLSHITRFLNNISNISPFSLLYYLNSFIRSYPSTQCKPNFKQRMSLFDNFSQCEQSLMFKQIYSIVILLHKNIKKSQNLIFQINNLNLVKSNFNLKNFPHILNDIFNFLYKN